MTRQQVKEALIEVLATIQEDSGYAPVPITGATCPLDDLEGFDSKIWTTAISMISRKLGVVIPNSKNIWISRDGKRKLTIDETVDAILDIISKGRADHAGT